MYSAIQNNELINIEDYTTGKIFCPVCNEELIAKRGIVKQHHFAHKSKVDCDSWAEMSIWHREWQNQFSKEYREVIIKEDDKTHRADIKIENLIIEFQNSTISSEDFLERNKFYSVNNNLIGIFNCESNIDNIKTFNDTLLVWKYSKKFANYDFTDNLQIFIQTDSNTLYKLDYYLGSTKVFQNYTAIFTGTGFFYQKFTKDEFLDYIIKVIDSGLCIKYSEDNYYNKWEKSNQYAIQYSYGGDYKNFYYIKNDTIIQNKFNKPVSLEKLKGLIAEKKIEKVEQQEIIEDWLEKQGTIRTK